MSVKYDDYGVLSDDMDDLVRNIGNINLYFKDLSAEWRAIRVNSYKTLPVQFVSMLDEISDIQVCAEDGCLDVCYADWDFCEIHGVKK
jgi:hypothetical protein